MEEKKTLGYFDKFDKLPVGKFLWILLLVLGIGWTFDAMNSGLISFVLTPLVNELSLTSQVAGILLSAWLIGMFIGGITLGRLADHVGRKSTLLLSLALFSIPAGFVAFTSSWELIFLLRLVAGMGSSGYMVIGSTLLSEYTPTRVRGRFVSLLESAWAFGWLLASYFGLILIGAYGWRAIMAVGFLPLVSLPLLAIMIPESLRYLMSKGKREKAVQIEKKIGLEISEGESPPGVASKAGLKTLLSPAYRTRTLMLWVHWFAIVLTYWGIFLWLPAVLATTKGLGIARSLEFAFLITLAQIPGYLSGAWLIEKVGRKWLLVAYMAMAALSSFLFAGSTTEWQVLLFASLVSFFNLGAWGITYAYTPELYPTSIRASGAGTANSVGRLGGIIGPAMAGFLAAQFGGSFYLTFIIFAAFFLISAVVVAILGVETKGKPLED